MFKELGWSVWDYCLWFLIMSLGTIPLWMITPTWACFIGVFPGLWLTILITMAGLGTFGIFKAYDSQGKRRIRWGIFGVSFAYVALWILIGVMILFTSNNSDMCLFS